MRTGLWFSFAVIALALTGCPANPMPSSSPPPSTTTGDLGPESSQLAEPAIKSLAPADVNLVVGDEKKFAEVVEAHKGKVVFVDFWATWCGPCIEYFPHTVATHAKYKDRGLATIAVNFDLLEDETKVREFLAKQSADFTNLMSNYDDVGQDVATAFEWSELPEFRLYDRTGKLRHEWTAKPEDLEKRIEELLAEKAASGQ